MSLAALGVRMRNGEVNERIFLSARARFTHFLPARAERCIFLTADAMREQPNLYYYYELFIVYKSFAFGKYI